MTILRVVAKCLEYNAKIKIFNR